MWTVSLRFDAKVRVSKANDTEAERKEEGSYRGRPSMQMKISSSSSRFTLLLLFSLLPGKNRFPACSRTYRKLGESIAFRSISDFFSLSERKKRKKNTRILLSIHFFFLLRIIYSLDLSLGRKLIQIIIKYSPRACSSTTRKNSRELVATPPLPPLKKILSRTNHTSHIRILLFPPQSI